MTIQPGKDAPGASSQERSSPSNLLLSRSATLSLILLWVACIASLPIWTHFELPGWDTAIYLKAARYLQLGRDPYAEGMAVQRLAHLGHPWITNPGGPFSYVYSPITLPFLRLFNALPFAFAASVYWLFYGAGIAAEVWFGVQLQSPTERRALVFFTPLAIFFPGLLGSDIVLSGNTAFLLYGLILVLVLFALRHGQWRWFYLAVLLASCVKAPLLSLLAIPVLSAPRQWLRAGVMAMLGLAVFGAQALIWPILFRHYLQTVELQFSFNRDFGVSPAGMLGGYLFDRHISAPLVWNCFYLAYALPLFALLFLLSKRYLRGDFPLQRWLPVLLVGVILLNPRILEYDLSPLALPMALIAWRFLRSLASPRSAMICFTLFFFGSNALALTSWSLWKLTEGPLLIAIFAAGVWSLLQQTPQDSHEISSAKLQESQPTAMLLI